MDNAVSILFFDCPTLLKQQIQNFESLLAFTSDRFSNITTAVGESFQKLVRDARNCSLEISGEPQIFPDRYRRNFSL